MSVMSDVFKGIKDTLINATNGVDPEKPINVYLGTPDAINDWPAAVVMPEGETDLLVAINGNTFKGTMRISTFIKVGDDADGWRQLFDYMDPIQGTKSVIRALRADRRLNALVDDSQVRSMGKPYKAAEGIYAFDLLLDYVVSVA